MNSGGALKPAGTGSYVVSDGESVESIAFHAGFLPETLWKLNGDVAAERKDRNVLLPGDRLEVPPVREKEQDCATDQRHRFRRKSVPSRFRLQVLDDGVPQAGMPYEFWFAEVEKTGKLDGNGFFEEWIPPDLEEAHLKVDLPRNTLLYQLRFGFLYPIESRVGVKQRLKNLGYFREELDQESTPGYVWALREFQRDYGLEETGEANGATVAKLLEVHDAR